MLLALVLAFGGFGALAIAMDRHYRALRGTTLSKRAQTAIRLGGVLAICGSTGLCVAAEGWSIGLTWAVGLFALAAIAVLFALTYLAPSKPRSR